MPEGWLTYRQLGEIWNISPEAARVRCRRANYQRRTNENGTAEVLVDVDELASRPYRGSQVNVNWTAAAPTEENVSDEIALRTIYELEAQAATLSNDLSRTEAQLEAMRRHLAAEREQVSHLMTALLRSEKRKRGIFGFLLFWRKTPQKTRPLTEQKVTPTPDMVTSVPDNRPDAGPHTPYILQDKPPETRTGVNDQ